MIDLRILAAGAACLALIQGARAQSAPEELVKTRAAFAAAVAANNEKAAAELSAFPLINRVDQGKLPFRAPNFGVSSRPIAKSASAWSRIGSSPKRPLKTRKQGTGWWIAAATSCSSARRTAAGCISATKTSTSEARANASSANGRGGRPDSPIRVDSVQHAEVISAVPASVSGSLFLVEAAQKRRVPIFLPFTCTLGACRGL